MKIEGRSVVGLLIYFDLSGIITQHSSRGGGSVDERVVPDVGKGEGKEKITFIGPTLHCLYLPYLTKLSVYLLYLSAKLIRKVGGNETHKSLFVSSCVKSLFPSSTTTTTFEKG